MFMPSLSTHSLLSCLCSHGYMCRHLNRVSCSRHDGLAADRKFSNHVTSVTSEHEPWTHVVAPACHPNT